MSCIAAPFLVAGIAMVGLSVFGPERGAERLAPLLGGTVFLIVSLVLLAPVFPQVVNRVRNAESPAVRRFSRRAPVLAMRTVIAIMFFTPMLMATGVIPTQGTLPAPRWVGIVAAAVFMVGGAYVLLRGWLSGLPAGARRRVEGLFPLAIVTCFAIIADWIALGSGDRAFTTSFGVGGFGAAWLSDELVGRAVFGVSGLFLSAITVVGWWKYLRDDY